LFRLISRIVVEYPGVVPAAQSSDDATISRCRAAAVRSRSNAPLSEFSRHYFQQVRAVCDVTHSPSPTDLSEAPIELLLLLLLDSTTLCHGNNTRMIPGDVCY